MPDRTALLLTLALVACTPEFDGEAQEADCLDHAELLVIAPESLATAWEPFAAWKRARGLPTRIVTVEEIDATEVGRDSAARIRAHITRSVEQDGTRWVLLGADTPLVPHREVRTHVDVEFEYQWVEEDMASELYYADLDGSWDGDGDGVYAEPEDGMDLVPEISVGRVPARTQAEVATYVDKVLQYERWPVRDHITTAALLGGWAANYGGIDIYASAALETIFLPLFPASFEITRLYEDHQTYDGALPLDAATQEAVFSDGQALALNFGHGTLIRLGALDLYDTWDLGNTGRPMIFTTTECNGCEFEADLPEHVACEAFVLAEGGGVAYLGNTDWGIGFPSLTEFYRILYEDLFGDGLDLTLGERIVSAQIGFTDQAALSEEGHADRWTMLTMVLAGDPTLRVWNSAAAEADLSRGKWYVRGEDDVVCYQVEARGEPAVGATVALHGPGDFLLVDHTDEAGEACFVPPDGTGQFRATVTGPGLVPAERTDTGR